MNKIRKLFLVFIMIIFLIYSIISKSFVKNNKNQIIKKILLSKIYKITRRNINKISTIFISGKANFGNYFISINNAIIYCEFLGCKNIIMENNKKIYINKTIFYNKSKFAIKPNQPFNSRDNNSVILNVFFFFNGFRYLRNINRLKIFKKQIINNLPKIVTHPNDLCIYIRGGDIFQQIPPKSGSNYFQPPLCFYVKILNEFKFRKVFIISKDKLNIVIPNLLFKYSYVKKKKNNIKIDISYLVHSYNLVAAKSSFFLTSIKFNDKLKFLWEYDCSTLYQKYLHLHYSIYDSSYYYTIYKMNSSNNYRKLMHPWINSPNQRQLMIIEKCTKNFTIIRG
jgi:hypothetical protein